MLRYYITDGRRQANRAGWLLERMAAAAAAGVDYIQLREKDLSAREQFELARAAVERLRAFPATRLLINDRLDVALAAGAQGVHLPAAGLELAAARRLAPPGFLLARSCHTSGEVAAAAAAGADFAVLGPIFATPSKPGAAPLGLQCLAEACRLPLPVLALGGINAARAADCLAAGAAGVAAIRWFQQADCGSPEASAAASEPNAHSR